MEAQRKYQKKTLKIKYPVTEMANAFMGLSVDLIWLMKEMVSLKIGQQKLFKLEYKKKKEQKKSKHSNIHFEWKITKGVKRALLEYQKEKKEWSKRNI